MGTIESSSGEAFLRVFRHAAIPMAINRSPDLACLEVNARFRELVDEATGAALEPLLRQVLEKGRVSDVPLSMEAADGRRLQFLYSGETLTLDGELCIVSSLVDSGDRARLAAEREVMLKLMGLLNAPGGERELIRTVTGFLRDWSGCDAVGVRLEKGEDFPYFESLGFPPQFIEAENRLCARDARGTICRDSQGLAQLECICGAVIRGRVDLARPFITPMGSFWTNSTSELIASLPPSGLGVRTRGRCLREGFESVALVPLRSSGESLGLLQFDDRRRGRFTPELIELLERAATALALALHQRRLQAALNQSELRLEQARKLESVGRLAGGVAHDFNNQLVVINGYALLLLSELGPKHPLRPALESIYAAGTRVARLTGQLLAFSRKQMLHPRLLDLNDVLMGFRKMIVRLLGEDVELEFALSGEPAMVRADPSQLEQVVLNLATNAREAMPHGGRLTIETRIVERDKRWVLMEVRDNGTGMDEATRMRLFEPFFTTKPMGKGSGLGLATAHGIIAQSGGFIEVESEPGQGATFRVYLPAATGVAPDPVARTVLVVEDQEQVRTYIEVALESIGYHVITAADVAEALAICERADVTIDLLMTAVAMPGRRGPELVSRVEKLRPGIRVLYMSDYPREQVLRSGMPELEAVLLQKPFTPDQLATKVREALE